MGFHRRLAPSGLNRGAGAALCALSAVAAALGAVPANAASSGHTRAEVDRLYRQAEEATEAYNKAGERAAALRREVNGAQDRIARRQQDVNGMREALGSLAGAQYRSGGIDPTVALLFSDGPEDYLDRASLLGRIDVRRAGQLRELQGAIRELAQERTEAAGKLAELERSRRAVASRKATVEKKLATARRLIAALPAADRAAFEHASRGDGRAGLPDLSGATAPDGR
ncbi:hypothetical protein AB0D38_39770, partial [Streptomyces sp. NPDC048279]|uniref:coiled-coil domain-containing protein n=1 Tax=Streptomyces sp. NPDC048279 TaxID=3154714 RepID=UPI00344676DB